MPTATRHSVCPHDCPSACALEVEVIDTTRIGAVRGAKANTYTDGVICAKVSRYADRIHHPDRLTHPLLRTGPKGSGQFRQIGWDEALDRLAENFIATTNTHGATAVWPYYYAGTMGLVQRDGINRLRHAMRYSDQKSTICSTVCEAGWMAGVGKITGPDPREMAQSDLIVVWGGNPVNTQVNVMTHIAKARKSRGAKLVVVDPYRTGTAQAADIHLAIRPGTDAALACAVMHVAFRDGYADRAYMATYADDPASLESHIASRDSGLGKCHNRPLNRRNRGFRTPLLHHRTRLYPHRLRLHPHAQRCRQPARRHLPAHRHRQMEARKRRRVLA